MHIRWSYFTHGHISALLTLCEWNPRIFLKGKFWEALVLSLFWARAIWWANSRVAFDARLIWHRRHAWQWSSKSAGAGRPGHWPYNDDVIKWKHFPCHWPFVRGIHRSPVNSPHKGQWSGALIFFLICAWINGWVNNGEAGDLRRHRTHYNVTVLYGWERQFKGTSLISYMSLWAHTHLSYWIDLRQHEDAFTFFISQHLAALVFFNPSSSKAKTGLFYIMNTFFPVSFFSTCPLLLSFLLLFFLLLFFLPETVTFFPVTFFPVTFFPCTICAMFRFQPSTTRVYRTDTLYYRLIMRILPCRVLSTIHLDDLFQISGSCLILASGSAVFFESCAAIVWKACDKVKSL